MNRSSTTRTLQVCFVSVMTDSWKARVHLQIMATPFHDYHTVATNAAVLQHTPLETSILDPYLTASQFVFVYHLNAILYSKAYENNRNLLRIAITWKSMSGRLSVPSVDNAFFEAE